MSSERSGSLHRLPDSDGTSRITATLPCAVGRLIGKILEPVRCPVLRSAVFILMMLCFMSAFSAPVAARPADPDSCHFTDGFLAFREALGEGIVGECESNQTYDRFGHARQTTSEGTLFWDRRRNLVSFHSGSHLWMDGPGGIASHVTIGGLSDKHAERASVSASAAVVLELASLRAGDLDGAWWY
jgi:hypothetical protein